MRVFELTTHLKGISRGDGRSATAAAAYRACCVIECQREGRTHDYSRKAGLEAAEIVTPDDAPAWAADRAKLWNAAELSERNKDRRAKTADKRNARPARELLFTFPVELSAAGRLNVARTIARHLAETHGVVADFAIHQPGKDGDERNHHCHLMMTARRITAKGLGEKAREWDDLRQGAALSKRLREFVATTLNLELAAEQKADQVHVEHRSFKERGEMKRATVHDGPAVTIIRRKEQAQARGAWQKAAGDKQAMRQREERASLAERQQATLRAKLDHMAEQERRGIETIRADLARHHAADQQAGGMRRMFDVATGRAGRDDQARAQRAADRERLAERTIEEFKRGMQAEREAFALRQKQEAKELDERHHAEDRQFGQAASARVRADRLAEVQARRDRVQGQEQSRHQGLERTR